MIPALTLVDSSGWVEYFANGPLVERYVEFLNRPKRVLTPTLVLHEVYKKLKREFGEELALMAAAQMEKTQVAPLTESIAYQAADLGLEYKLSTADSIIYATAVSYGVELVTSDSDFKGLPRVSYFPSEE
jgi:toxin FitB